MNTNDMNTALYEKMAAEQDKYRDVYKRQDQRIVNQLLPDEPGTKVNQCVDNIMQIWRDGEAEDVYKRQI